MAIEQGLSWWRLRRRLLVIVSAALALLGPIPAHSGFDEYFPLARLLAGVFEEDPSVGFYLWLIICSSFCFLISFLLVSFVTITWASFRSHNPVGRA